MIRVVVADDRSLVRAGFAALVRSEADMAVVGEAVLDVLRLVASGLSNDQIAAELVISPLTAKTHVTRILAKLRCRDRAQLVVLTYETGFVTPGTRSPKTSP